jgi:hypothetical protein
MNTPIVIIDNERKEVMHLGNLLEAAFPDTTILPERSIREATPFKEWETAFDYLLSIEGTDLIVCLDLSLGPHFTWEDVNTGLGRARLLRDARPHWTFVAYTKSIPYAREDAGFAAVFDGVIDKAELARQIDFVSAVRLVRSSVEEARRKRTLPDLPVLADNVRVIDSFGIRLFRAGFSDDVLAEILSRETSEWGSVKVESLTSGYSGAFMLRLSSDSGASLILKVAKMKETIASEVSALSAYLHELAPYGARLNQISSTIERLKNGAGFYYRQMPIKGRTLLQCCLEGGRAHIEESASVCRMCINVLEAVPIGLRPRRHARERFRLNAVDVGRVEASAEFVSGLGVALARERLWPSALPGPREVCEEVVEVARTWSSAPMTDIVLAEAVQHGDLNPGNVMIDVDGVPVLIDFQRLGRWPIGYDMARLSGLLRVRVTDSKLKDDHLPFRLRYWHEGWVRALDGDYSASLCSEADYCEQQFYSYCAKLPEPDRDGVRYGFYLGALWDMLKIASYQDLSSFKRTWAFSMAWSLARKLRGRK